MTFTITIIAVVGAFIAGLKIGEKRTEDLVSWSDFIAYKEAACEVLQKEKDTLQAKLQESFDAVDEALKQRDGVIEELESDIDWLFQLQVKPAVKKLKVKEVKTTKKKK